LHFEGEGQGANLAPNLVTAPGPDYPDLAVLRKRRIRVRACSVSPAIRDLRR
jgi:hypothetical protein